MSSNQLSKGFGAEICLILRRSWQVWRLVPIKHKLGLAGACGIMAAVSSCNIANARLLGNLVDVVGRGSPYLVAVGILGLIAVAYLVRESLNVARRYLVENICTRLHRDMSVRVVNHLLKINLATLSKEKVGTLHGRIYRSVEGFVRFLRLSFLDFIPALLTGLLALIYALWRQPLLGLIMMGVIPAAVFLTIRQLILQKGVRLNLNRSCDEIDGAIVEQLGGIEYVRAANTYPQEIKRLARATEKRRAMEFRYYFQMALFGSAKALNEGFLHVIVLGVAVSYALTHPNLDGTIDTGIVVTFSVLFLNVMTPLSELHRVFVEGHESSLRVGDLLELLAEPLDPSFHLPRSYEPKLRPGAPAIVVNDLHVVYVTPQGKHLHALDHLSLIIRHGETIGIAGRSGCGKSTFVRVLLRLLHPNSGELFLGGGYNAPVTERGGNLSGGQRQRLAIARILLKQPPVLILDEATSALDNISERVVQQALGVRSADRTTILVAHRLSTLRDADRIFVFEEGKIAEVGTYVELVQQGGLFRELVLSAENGLSGPPAEGVAAQPEPMAQSA